MSTERIGIFYSHNRVAPSILQAVIQHLNRFALERSIIATTYTPLSGFTGTNLIAKVRTPGHLSIALQVLQTLIYVRKEVKEVEYVAFLEHDILYPSSYFNFPDFTENVLCHKNYIQLSSKGFEHSKGGKPLSQLVMKFDFAIKHFHEKVVKIFEGDLKLEPRNEKYLMYDSPPSLHFRHASFTTNHFDTFNRQYYRQDEHWGTLEKWIETLGKGVIV